MATTVEWIPEMGRGAAASNLNDVLQSIEVEGIEDLRINVIRDPRSPELRSVRQLPELQEGVVNLYMLGSGLQVNWHTIAWYGLLRDVVRFCRDDIAQLRTDLNGAWDRIAVLNGPDRPAEYNHAADARTGALNNRSDYPEVIAMAGHIWLAHSTHGSYGELLDEFHTPDVLRNWLVPIIQNFATAERSAEFIARHREEMAAAERESLVETLHALTIPDDHDPQRLRDRAANKLDEAHQLQKDVLRMEMQAADLMRQAQVMQAQLAAVYEGFDPDAEIEILQRHEMVHDIVVGPARKSLVIMTNEIKVPNPYVCIDRTDIVIGRFNLTISRSDSEYGDTRWRLANTTNPRGGIPHPHVGPDGTMCTGEAGRSVVMLLNQGKLAPAVALILDLLGQVNIEDGWGNRLRAWLSSDELAELERWERAHGGIGERPMNTPDGRELDHPDIEYEEYDEEYDDDEEYDEEY